MLLGALLLAACSSSGSSSPTTSKAAARPSIPTSSVPVTTTTVPSAQQYLLSISDLPTGWSVDNTQQSATDSCYYDPLTKVPSASYAHAAFAEGGNVPELVEELAVFTSPSAASSAFTTIKHTLDGCTQFNETSNSETITGTMGAMSSPSYGNKSTAYDATLNVEGETLNQGFVVVQKGPFVVAVALGDIGSVDSDTLQGFVAQGVGKLPVG